MASCTFICSKFSLDGVYPPYILAINAKRLGMDATIFHTFMGIQAILKGKIKKAKFIPPGFLGAIPGIPTFITWIMKRMINKANIPSLEELQEMAIFEGVKLVACKMTVDMMKLNKNDFIDGVEIKTAEQYLKVANQCQINMFI